MNGTEVAVRKVREYTQHAEQHGYSRVFKEMNKKGFCGLLKSQKSRALPSKTGTRAVVDHVGRHIQGDFPDLEKSQYRSDKQR